ncbi:MAG: DUF4097 family beta strand repeat-containing protein [Gemmatimonadaceae bacterium]
MKYRIAILAAAILSAVACSRPGTNDRAFEWTNRLPPGAVVHLRDGTGDIVVRRSPDQSVNVTGGVQWKHSRSSDVKFQVNQVGNDYYVCAMWRASGKCGDKGYHGRQTNGFLTMFSLFHRSSDARADFVAELPANVVVDAKTDFGSVTVDGLAAGVTARAATGTVTANNVSGPLSLSTATGNVNLTTDSLSAADSVHLQTTNGTVRAELPANLQGAFDLSVVNGTVTSAFPLGAAPRSRVGRHLQGQIGASNRVVKMRAVNGTVSVTTRGTHAEH